MDSNGFNSPMKENPLGVAARYNDAECEEKGIADVISSLGLQMRDVLYISEQRALRVVLDGLEMPAGVPIAVGLSQDQIRDLITLQSCVLDGIGIGWRAHQISQRDTAYAPPTYAQAVDLIRAIVHDFSEDEAKAILNDVTLPDNG